MSIPKKKWKDLNADPNLPTHNASGHKIVIGCNYHTTWQRYASMRFVLTEVVMGKAGELKARLETRTTGNNFFTNINQLIFINSPHNKRKAKELRP